MKKFKILYWLMAIFIFYANPTSTIAGLFSNELKFRGYECIKGKASKNDGYIELTFIVKDKRVIQKSKSVDTDLKKESMHNIMELSDCEIFDGNNWKCGGGTKMIGSKPYESIRTQLVDGYLFFGYDYDTNLPTGCTQRYVWVKN